MRWVVLSWLKMSLRLWLLNGTGILTTFYDDFFLQSQMRRNGLEDLPNYGFAELSVMKEQYGITLCKIEDCKRELADYFCVRYTELATLHELALSWN